MKTYLKVFLGLLLLGFTSISSIAQVRIEVPASNILYGNQFSIVKDVLNTGGNDKWNNQTHPTFWSISGEFFTHTSLSGVTLPTSILLWQLQSIGGTPAPFRTQDVLPNYQWFTTSPKNWYQPHSTAGHYTPGNVAFTFKISSEAFLNNTFIAGEYSLTVTHNYGTRNDPTFTPETFQIILSIPSTNPIQWISNNTPKYYEISSLAPYRSGGAQLFDAIGPAEVSNTINFNLWAKSAATSIQLTTSKGVETTRPVSLITLGSNHPKIITSSLSASWQNYSPNSHFTVEAGNRNNFELQFSISEANFKNHFFEAGTYKFQLNLDAKSLDNTVSAIQNTDMTLKVLPLSEITIPTSGNEVNFVFNTAADYQNGKSKIIPNQIKLSNNETYEFYVKSGAAYFNRSGIQSDVASSILQVGIEGGSQNVSLSTTPQKIITNGTPVLDKNLNLEYSITAIAAQTLIAKEKSTYSINVIYSFTAL